MLMKLTFIGADHEVTGSCHFLEVGDTKVLIDCGMEQGNNPYQNAELPVSYSDIDYVFLTHAHIDHAGMLPWIYARGFKGQIIMRLQTCVALCFGTVPTFRRWRQSGAIVKHAEPAKQR